jgi:hypothetical protein
VFVVLVEAAAELLAPQRERDGEDAVDDQGQEGDGAEDGLLEVDVEYTEYDETLDQVGDKHEEEVGDLEKRKKERKEEGVLVHTSTARGCKRLWKAAKTVTRITIQHSTHTRHAL